MASTAPPDAPGETPELSIVLPCLNEAGTLGTCIDKARTFLREAQVRGEVVVADNGSSDGSPEVAAAHGARLVRAPVRGYGAALMAGIEAARGRYVIMGDADDSYDFTALGPFVAKLREGFDLVMGNRFRGGIRPGAMPPLHRYLGNPVLSAVGRLLFRSPVGDFHCGLRGFRRDAIRALDLRTTGMEFASEMVVKATLRRLRIAEVPTTLSPDGRGGRSHLRSWRDGWRHLRFLLIFCPRWLFLYPGLALTAAGLAGLLWLLPGPRQVGDVVFDIHTMLYAGLSVIVGLQVTAFALFAKVFATGIGLLPKDDRVTRALGVLTLERGLVAGLLLGLAGLAGAVYAFAAWGQADFGTLDPTRMMRITIPALTALAVGVQIGFSSFLLSVLGLAHR